MLDLFTIFSKGGIVLWCFQSTSQIFTPSVNALISNVILQERSGKNSFEHNNLMLKYKLDNEFELVFVIAYQKILQLSYVDKFLDDIHLEFRDKYKNVLESNFVIQEFEFKNNFEAVMREAERWEKSQGMIVKPMRTFKESEKSKKTIASMIIKKTSDNKENKKKEKIEEISLKKEPLKVTNGIGNNNITEDVIQQNRMKLTQKLASLSPKKVKQKQPKIGKESKSKKPRVWELGGNNTDLTQLDYTKDKVPNGDVTGKICNDSSIVGQMVGGIRDLEVSSSDESEDNSPSDDEVEYEIAANKKKRLENKSGGVFSLFKGLVGNKSITSEMMQPVLEKLKEHLIGKNVAADIAKKLCDSVAAKLEGKVIGTFETVSNTIKNTMTDALVQILSPKRRVDILRDVLEAKSQGRPYVMAFCGVNGVGKSTNLAKICFWLIENNLQVLIAACDTFRAGAVEQLRTHTRHLNALHPPSKHNGLQMVQLYEKGYGKDAAGIALEAINFAKDSKVDVVLIDTAGRMQDNEPLMRALSKLVKVNDPDLVLFVGEALVGNEAVDQLVKFNQAMADYSMSTTPHVIDGIVLTKFDTIDDKVGAAISMTYITGQPIVFVGTGQTYTDLKSLNAKAVVSALMK